MYLKTVILLANCLAFGLGLLALLLPNWSSGNFEEVRNVTVVKEIDSGLFNEKNEYYMKEDSILDSSEEIPGSFMKPEVVKIIRALMITGLSLLSIVLIHSVFQWCCYDDDETVGKTDAVISLILSLVTILAGGFILSGPLIYKNHVVAEFEPEKTSFGASWYMALSSAGLTFILGIVSVLHSFWLFGVISNNKKRSVSRGKSREKRQKVYTV
ncbi:uncharacterized protein LOC132740585 [Ruditapes philippinarum]|uniref:uncharacterized protein LOC132740585 n=1 Tax=Ruditapes philippinarum TaxID=129788 RepID=UPI00295AB48A|nr:uncharacterized protein LOC132740585 [Ruditapes philippinarum]